MSREQEQFMRIAMARLVSRYPFEPQRRAVASKMYVRWFNRKDKIKRKAIRYESAMNRGTNNKTLKI